MYLKELKIKNFRGIKEGIVNFKEGTNILIGPSNIGKTSLIEAIEFLLCPKKQWWRRDILSEHDFYYKNCEEDIIIDKIEITRFLNSSIKFVKKAYKEREVSISPENLEEKYYTAANELLQDVSKNC